MVTPWGTEPPPFTPFKDLDAIVRFDARNVKALRDSCRKPATNRVRSHSRPPRQTVRRFPARVTFPNTGPFEAARHQMGPNGSCVRVRGSEGGAKTNF
jgi:hypothetical protein